MLIAQDVADAAIEAAVRAVPREYCAALLGTRAPDRAMVTGLVRAGNADGAAGLFDISQAEARHAAEVARRRGLHILAWLHSHPSGCLDLSDLDKASLAHSDVPWVLLACGTGGPAWAAYAGGTFDQVPIRFGAEPYEGSPDTR